jgi:L-alanine-DL-glutamate epimerase-like enolase superfamily enzyme
VLATDICIEDVTYDFEDFLYRTPIKFGGVAVDRVTLLNVHIRVRTVNKSAIGFGSMPLGNVWSYPSRVLTYDETLWAMKVLAERTARIMGDCREWGHPIDLTHSLEPSIRQAAADVSSALKLKEPIPWLAALVVASPFDAALHDGLGKVHGCNVYHAYHGAGHLPRDLSHYLGPDFKDEFLENYISREPQPRMPLYHLVGALDPLTTEDVHKPVGDGLPESLPEWIRRDGLTHLKIKLNGDDLAWDVDRVVSVDRVASETQRQRGVTQWHYSLDFNERCPNVGYLLEFLRKLQERTPAGFDRVQYIEQPTARDLKANRDNVMHEAAKLRPIVIDESLIDLESLLLARDMGYTGAALKACKGQTQSLLLAAAAKKLCMFLCVQDLTCPGASLIHSAGLAAHIPGVAAIESNARQYVPAANAPWASRFPGIFHITDGMLATGELTGPGLGAIA